MRVQPVVDGEVDAGHGLAGARQSASGERARRPREREDRAVVVGVGVRLGRQQAGAAERSPNPAPIAASDGRVAAVGDVGDGEECGG